MKKLFAEFKAFIMRGNVLDMAVGVIIATAFGAITTTLVQKVLMPLIGCIFGGVDLDKLNIVLKPEVLNEAGEVAKEAVVMEIGTFITAIINFFIVALIVFLIVKAFNKAREAAAAKKAAEAAAEEEPAEEAEPAPTAEELLAQILEELQKKA